jgi:hypothetical protein
MYHFFARENTAAQLGSLASYGDFRCGLLLLLLLLHFLKIVNNIASLRI